MRQSRISAAGSLRRQNIHRQQVDQADRTVIGGESPHRLAAGVGGDEGESSDSEDDETGVARGTVFRLVKGQLRKLEGGMEQYEAIAARSAAKLGRRRPGG